MDAEGPSGAEAPKGGMTPTVRVLAGDARAVLRGLPPASVQCVLTSPPYYRQRTYLPPGDANARHEIGREKTPEAYIGALVAVFEETRRVLADDGLLWLNLGDTYIDRQLALIPVRVALALQAGGWVLRSKIVWRKTKAHPEPVRDRPTSTYEEVFLFAKRERGYYYDQDAIRVPYQSSTLSRYKYPGSFNGGAKHADDGSPRGDQFAKGRKPAELHPLGRNAPNVWDIATVEVSRTHTATMPPQLAAECIKAGSRPGDTVLDPFCGSGTSGVVAGQLGRNAILVELNAETVSEAIRRVAVEVNQGRRPVVRHGRRERAEEEARSSHPTLFPA